MTEELTWSGAFHGSVRQLKVPASPEHPFSTDLASVPRSLTWLFPRYGKYTKEKGDRKSTRLNSSHITISYAAFCLKKKKAFLTARGPTPTRPKPAQMSWTYVPRARPSVNL